MWEDEYKKTRIRNVLIGVVLVVIVAGLAMAMLSVKKQIAAEDQKLSVEKVNQQQQQSDARQENIDAIQVLYEKDMETVARYLPGIVCWGDSVTSGSSGNASYPYTLQKYINTYLCDIYDFRASVPNAEDYARLNWNDYKVSIPVVNMGSGQENSATVLGRVGVQPYVVKSEFVIPADRERVAITIAAADGSNVNPLTAGNAGLNPVTIAGVEGTLTLETERFTKVYYFQRAEAGQEVKVEKQTQILTANREAYRDYIHIVWLGTYDTYRNASELVRDTKLLLERQVQNGERYLVIGPCTINGSWSADCLYALDSIDSAMLQAFGSHYVNVRKYLCEDGMADAGLTPSKNEAQQMNRGFVPESFRSGAGSADLNGKAYNLIGKLVYERMDRLGYFSEVREELGIDKTTQDIIKKDPKYFETMLKVSG